MFKAYKGRSMPEPDFQLGLMKLLSTKHFPLRKPRRTVKMDMLVKAMARIGTEGTQKQVFEVLNLLKGRGLVNTDPKIMLREEVDTAEFEIWLTPLGRTDLQSKLAAG